MKKQRILLLTRSLQMGGVERNTVNLANTLVELGNEVHILSYKKRFTLKPNKNVIVHFHDFDKINRQTVIGLIYDLLTRLTLSAFIRKSGFVWRGLYFVLYFRVFLKLTEKKYGRFDKIIARGEGSFEHLWSFKDQRFYQVVVSPIRETTNPLDKWFKKLVYKNKNVIANSSGVKASFIKKMNEYNIAVSDVPVIPNPCPIKTIQSKANEKVILPENPYVIHVGRLTYQKNQALLLESYAESKISEELIIIGSGQEESRLRKLCKKLDIEEQVKFIGQKENPYPWMKHAKLFILTSRFEGFGLVNVESLACGTPVVAAECPGGLHDILIEEQSALIAQPNAKAIAEKINYALNNPIIIKPEWYEKFDADKVARQFLSL